jgi:hypothetical protein
MRAPQSSRVGSRRAGLVALCLLLAAGCSTIPDQSMELSPDSLKLRQLQTRRIEGIDENALLAASAGVLQDLGFNIDESETRLGVIVASKDRSALDLGDTVEDVLVDSLVEAALDAMFSALFGDHFDDDDDEDGEDIVYDVTQKIRISVVTRPALDSSGQRRQDAQVIRITIQRLVWDSEGELSHSESIEDPKVYQKFFDRLSKSIFLELQAI